MLRLVRCLAVLLFLAASAVAENSRAWERWDGCTLAAERYFDGDSFHVRRGSATYVLRLYFADAPEIDEGYAARLAAQAAHFGVTEAEVLHGGATAKAFAERFLAKPFRVITRRQAAPGASQTPRIYAIIERDGGHLDAALIQAGLARATSVVADYPDATRGSRRAYELRVFEQTAALNRKGLWAHSQRIDRPPQTTGREKTPQRKGARLPAVRKVNLNLARESDLEALPGIGPKTAQAIIRARPLRDFEQLDAVPGIGPKMIADLRPFVSF